MVPGADEGVAIEIGEDGVDLGEVDALGVFGFTRGTPWPPRSQRATHMCWGMS